MAAHLSPRELDLIHGWQKQGKTPIEVHGLLARRCAHAHAAKRARAHAHVRTRSRARACTLAHARARARAHTWQNALHVVRVDVIPHSARAEASRAFAFWVGARRAQRARACHRAASLAASSMSLPHRTRFHVEVTSCSRSTWRGNRSEEPGQLCFLACCVPERARLLTHTDRVVFGACCHRVAN